MFGFKGGKNTNVVLRKKGYMQDAQKKWGFLTDYHLSTINTQGQLVSIVKTRSGMSEAQANKGVRGWMAGKQF